MYQIFTLAKETDGSCWGYPCGIKYNNEHAAAVEFYARKSEQARVTIDNANDPELQEIATSRGALDMFSFTTLSGAKRLYYYAAV